jgi:RNA polymerase sigma factor (sigma-70 family)
VEVRLDKVVRARNGDAQAFEALVVEFTPQVYRIARAMLGESAAPDAAQEVFLAVWRELPRLRDPASFAPRLHRICINRCRSVLRARRVKEISLGPSHEMVAAPDVRADVETVAALMPALLRLSPDQRSVIALHYGADLTIVETANVLGVPAGTVKSRLNAGLAALRRGMDEVAE